MEVLVSGGTWKLIVILIGEDDLVNNMCNLIIKVNSIKINEKSKLITKVLKFLGR